jgi:hypothetical protein
MMLGKTVPKTIMKVRVIFTPAYIMHARFTMSGCPFELPRLEIRVLFTAALSWVI